MQHPCVRAGPVGNGGLGGLEPPTSPLSGSGGFAVSSQKNCNHHRSSAGIGAGLVEGSLKDGYNVVATSLLVSQSLTATARLVLVDGDICNPETATKSVDAAIKTFRHHRLLVNNAGIFYTKPFTEFTSRLQCLGLDELFRIPLHDAVRCETNVCDGARDGTSATADDRVLVAQAKCGCSVAFGKLYECHRLQLFRSVFRSREDAEDGR